MEVAFINGEAKNKTISLMGRPAEPISYKCIARQLVSLKEKLWNSIPLMKNLRKLTSTIRKSDESFPSTDDTRSFLSTIKKQWNSISTDTEPNAQFSLVKCSWKNLCWHVLLKKSFPWRNLYGNCLCVHEKQFELIARIKTSIFCNEISVKINFVFGNIWKVVSRTKNCLWLFSPKGQHKDFTFGDGKARWTNSKAVDPWKKSKKRIPQKSALGKRKPVQTTCSQGEVHEN